MAKSAFSNIWYNDQGANKAQESKTKIQKPREQQPPTAMALALQAAKIVDKAGNNRLEPDGTNGIQYKSELDY